MWKQRGNSDGQLAGEPSAGKLAAGLHGAWQPEPGGSPEKSRRRTSWDVQQYCVAIVAILAILALVVSGAYVSIRGARRYVLWGREHADLPELPARNWGLPGDKPWRSKLVLSGATEEDFILRDS